MNVLRKCAVPDEFSRKRGTAEDERRKKLNNIFHDWDH